MLRSGIALIDPGGSGEIANAVATLPDGSLLVAGYARTPGSDFIDFCLARLDPDGTIDIDRFVPFFIRNAYYSKSVRCKECSM